MADTPQMAPRLGPFRLNRITRKLLYKMTATKSIGIEIKSHSKSSSYPCPFHQLDAPLLLFYTPGEAKRSATGREPNPAATAQPFWCNSVSGVIQMELKSFIRDIPDFPTPGILFRDITPLLRDTRAFRHTIELLVDRFKSHDPDVIVAVESRGFIFGAPLAYELGKPMVPVRKPGKLPAATHKVEYSLEYGSDTMEIHVDGVGPGQRALLLDDLLATGGTLEASSRLVEMSGGEVIGIGVIIELTQLGGRDRLKGYDVHSLVQY